MASVATTTPVADDADRSVMSTCEAEETLSDTPDTENDVSDADRSGGKAARTARTRQSFTWRQVSVLEQVFESDPLPRQVAPLISSGIWPRARAAPRLCEDLTCPWTLAAGHSDTAGTALGHHAAQRPGLVPKPAAKVEGVAASDGNHACAAQDDLASSRRSQSSPALCSTRCPTCRCTPRTDADGGTP